MAVLVFLALLIVGITSVANGWKGELRVERVSVRGCRVLSEKDVTALAAVPLGVSLSNVDLLKVQKALYANPFIQRAVVKYDLPSTIKISIEERRPVAVLGGPELFYVDEEGLVLPAVTSREIFDLPVITGLSVPGGLKPGIRIDSEDLRTAIEILRVAASLDSEEGSESEIYHLISEIHLAGANPTVYTSEQGIPILFSKSEIERQLLCLQSFWRQYARQQGPEQLVSIDLRFDGHVIVRWAKTDSSGKSS